MEGSFIVAFGFLVAVSLIAGAMIAFGSKKQLSEMTLGELENEIRSLERRIGELKAQPGHSLDVLAGLETRLGEASSRHMIEGVISRPDTATYDSDRDISLEDRLLPSREQIAMERALRELEGQAQSRGQTTYEASNYWLNDMKLRKKAYENLGMSSEEASNRAFEEAGTDAPFPSEK